MKKYVKPEIELVSFASEAITTMGDASGDLGNADD